MKSLLIPVCTLGIVAGGGDARPPRDVAETETTAVPDEPNRASKADTETEQASEPTELSWREMFFEDQLPLENKPQIVDISNDGDELVVVVANKGTTTLEYFSAGASHIKLFQEHHRDGEWKPKNWDWCGTGKSRYEIAPGEQVDLRLRFWDPKVRERMLASFTEKGTDRAGLVVLAWESPSE